MSIPYFHRPALAGLYAKRILSDRGASGTFLAALRRTGKSTFIREDLIPVLHQSGALVVYVDLWSNKLADPGELIASAIRNLLREQEGMLAQAARKAGLEKLTLGGLQMNLDRVGLPSGVTIATALEALSQETKRPIVMVVDEAQHAQTTEQGSAALYALKAARDELNSSSNYGFRLVATGSNRDKLAILVQGKEQAFLSAKLLDLPYLDDDYLQWKLASFAGLAAPSLPAMKTAFKQCTYRPEVLADVLDDMELMPGLTIENVDAVLVRTTEKITTQAKAMFQSMFNSLEPLQAALLQTMAVQRGNFAPYTKATYDRCREFCATRTDEKVKIDNSSVGYSLELLRKQSLIWKSGRGVYAIEDTQHIAWLAGIPEAGLDSMPML
ncbi:MAG: ATP-binding protein [Pseudomonadota bacterium]